MTSSALLALIQGRGDRLFEEAGMVVTRNDDTNEGVRGQLFFSDQLIVLTSPMPHNVPSLRGLRSRPTASLTRT